MIHHGRARSIGSQINRTSVFGIIGGRPSRVGRTPTNAREIAKRTSGLPIPVDPVLGLAFMKRNNLLSVNPVGSGGVGNITNARFKFIW